MAQAPPFAPEQPKCYLSPDFLRLEFSEETNPPCPHEVGSSVSLLQNIAMKEAAASQRGAAVAVFHGVKGRPKRSPLRFWTELR